MATSLFGCEENKQKSDDASGLTTSIKLGESISIKGSGASAEESTVKISEGGTFVVSGTLTDGQIFVDADKAVTIVLNNTSITNQKGAAIEVKNAKKITLMSKKGTVSALSDEGTASEASKSAVVSNDTIILGGEGTVNITSTGKHGISCDDDIIIQDGTWNITGATDGIHANDEILVAGGKLAIKAGSDGMESEKNIIIDSGTITVNAGDDGIHAATALTIHNGIIDIAESYEGLEAKTALTINGGTIKVKAEDDGVNTGEELTMNGGYLTIDCEGDGLDSNGNMTINGGTVIGYSGNNANGPVDVGDRGYSMTVNGGTVLIGGGNMAITASNESKQNSVWLYSSFQKGSLLNLTEEGGNAEITAEITKNASAIFYSSEKLLNGKTYTVSTGGNSDGKSIDGIIEGGTYSKGTSLGSFTISTVNSSVGNGGMRADIGGRDGQNFDRSAPDGVSSAMMPQGEAPPDGKTAKNGRTTPDGMPRPDRAAEAGNTQSGQNNAVN